MQTRKNRQNDERQEDDEAEAGPEPNGYSSADDQTARESRSAASRYQSLRPRRQDLRLRRSIFIVSLDTDRFGRSRKQWSGAVSLFFIIIVRLPSSRRRNQFHQSGLEREVSVVTTTTSTIRLKRHW
ncbi:uncharacterized protein LOC134287472 [Aedes albopictus]|uniref:Uncharacterized protein n=1 Tax=Aedes albopictus TaxID=7160 RepID=A0ABM1Z9Y9_AEDAL